MKTRLIITLIILTGLTALSPTRAQEAHIPEIPSSGTTTRVSVASDGTQGKGGFGYWTSAISADGRYVAFVSEFNNLVPGDTNGSRDVFVHDRGFGTTTRVSVASDGTQGNRSSGEPSISADGRYVAFGSGAINLVPGDTNKTWDIFVYDRWTGTTNLVSVASDGTQGNRSSGEPSISADGRYVAFSSFATNLVSGDTNGYYDVFVHDLVTGTTSRVSVASDGTQGNSTSYYTAISAHGRYVAFHSSASNLVSGDTNDKHDVFVHDRGTGTTGRVSVASDGTQGNDSSGCSSHAISADGRYVTFTSYASGYYAFTYLVTGTYTLIPSKTGWTFTPASRIVIVPPSTTGQDFTGTPISPSGKPAVVLVHGWQGLSKSGGYACSGTVRYDGTNSTLGDLAAMFSTDYDVWIAHLESSPAGTPSLTENGDCLKDQIDTVYQQTGQKVVIVAHSMGGLVSRACLDLPECGSKVSAYELEEPRPHDPNRSLGKMGVAMDGTMVHIHTEGWKELKVGCVFEIGSRVEKDPQTKEDLQLGSAVNNTYVAHLGGPETFGRQIWAEARQRSWMDVEDSLAIGDGAPWIWNLVSEHFYTSHQLVDWFHATEHLAEAARIVYGEGTPKHRTWYRRWTNKLYFGHSRKLVSALKRQATLQPKKSETLLQQAGYFKNNIKRMNYLEMRMEGYPIGSGMVESAAKQYKGRFCAAGMRWSRRGAERLIPLRSAILSKRFDKMWQLAYKSPPS